MTHSSGVRRLVIIAMCASLVFVGKLSLLLLPNIEVVTFFLIIFTLTFRLEEALLISTVYTITESLLWSLTEQSYIWTVIVILTFLFKKVIKDRFILWSIFSGFLGLTFGLMCAVPIYFFTDRTVTISYLIANIPYDILHMVGNYFIMLFFGELIYKTLQKLLNGYDKEGNYY
jgi:hypothetical protein